MIVVEIRTQNQNGHILLKEDTWAILDNIYSQILVLIKKISDGLHFHVWKISSYINEYIQLTWASKQRGHHYATRQKTESFWPMSPVILIAVRVHISTPDPGRVSQSTRGWKHAGPGVSVDAAVCCKKNSCFVNPGMISDLKYWERKIIFWFIVSKYTIDVGKFRLVNL